MTASGRYSFDRFTLDVAERTLRRDDERVELNSRYLDALGLLVSEQGRLVPKERFLDEVWRGVPVTDEALTQCIRTLRRQLGDDAARPLFIETVPKHGYRFVASVRSADARVADVQSHSRFTHLRRMATAGTLGGGAAGLMGGLFYGFSAALSPASPVAGGASVLLVLLCVTTVIGLVGAAGVAFGIAAALSRLNRSWVIAGGALGGMIIGAIVKLIAVDGFTLLVGRSPGDITGPLEGAVLGAAVGLGVWLSGGEGSLARVRRSVAATAIAGGAGGALIVALGGRMMGGSLEGLERAYPESRIRLDALGQLFGESTFGPISQIVTGALEGALFGACVVAAMAVRRRALEQKAP